MVGKNKQQQQFLGLWYPSEKVVEKIIFRKLQDTVCVHHLLWPSKPVQEMRQQMESTSLLSLHTLYGDDICTVL